MPPKLVRVVDDEKDIAEIVSELLEMDIWVAAVRKALQGSDPLESDPTRVKV